MTCDISYFEVDLSCDLGETTTLRVGAQLQKTVINRLRDQERGRAAKHSHSFISSLDIEKIEYVTRVMVSRLEDGRWMPKPEERTYTETCPCPFHQAGRRYDANALCFLFNTT
jgi:hypothetical protein